MHAHPHLSLTFAGAIALLACMTDPAPSGREPDPCLPRDSGYFAGTAIQDRDGWYGGHLRAAGAPRLCPVAGQEAYRFTWLRTFHAPVVVAVTHTEKTTTLRVVRLSGAGGYEPGHPVRDTTLLLSDAAWAELRSRVSAADFWSMPTVPVNDSIIGLDGSQWVIEGTRAGEYHVVDRWSPMPPSSRREGPGFVELGLWLLARAGELPDDRAVVY